MSSSIHERTTRLKVTERALLAVVVLAAGGLIAACGSSSSTSTSSAAASATTSSTTAGTNAASSRRAALAACLKQHGVNLPARPSGSGGAGGGGSGTPGGGGRGFLFGGGGAAANPKLRAAFQACGARFGSGGGRFRGRVSRQAITNYVMCVRQHGYNLPNPNFSGKGPVFPASIRSDPKFQSASRACQSILAPPVGTSTTAGA
jgi:hypothetical protein